MFTPRLLRPLLDVTRLTGGDRKRLVDGGARPDEIADALMREVATGSPRCGVGGSHWADEATLDVARLVGRRTATVRALVGVTHREDELDRAQINAESPFG